MTFSHIPTPLQFWAPFYLNLISHIGPFPPSWPVLPSQSIPPAQYSMRVSAETSVGAGLPSDKQTVKTLQEAPEGEQGIYKNPLSVLKRYIGI